MNPDLAMADELLKKNRSGNLSTVFGQPDIDIRPAAGGAGELQVEIHGLDGKGRETVELSDAQAAS